MVRRPETKWSRKHILFSPVLRRIRRRISLKHRNCLRNFYWKIDRERKEAGTAATPALWTCRNQEDNARMDGGGTEEVSARRPRQVVVLSRALNPAYRCHDRRLTNTGARKDEVEFHLPYDTRLRCILAREGSDLFHFAGILCFVIPRVLLVCWIGTTRNSCTRIVEWGTMCGVPIRFRNLFSDDF